MLSQANMRPAHVLLFVLLCATATTLEAQQVDGSPVPDASEDAAPTVDDPAAPASGAPAEVPTDPAVQPEPEPEPDAPPEPEYVEWEEPEAAPGMPPAQRAVLVVRGQGVYARWCASCHGRRGDGRGPTARFSPSRPRDLTSGVYKWRTTPSGALPTDEDLLRTVRRGAPGTNMPAWSGRIPDADIQAVVQYIRTFSPRFEEEGVPPPLPMPSHRPAFDDAARRRGRLLYVLMQCWTCHGMDGTGDGPAADTLEDDDGRPIEAYDFTEGEYRGGRRPIDIYRTFTTGVNGTPMPQYHEALMVGRDGFEDLSQLEPVLDASGMAALRGYLARMPTTEEIWAMPEEERLAWAAGARWDMVAYVLALSRGSATWRYLWSPTYRTR